MENAAQFPVEVLPQIQEKRILRFLTCGSVDDGKSTLIGRLLHDAGLVYEDQLAAIKRESNTEEPDLSLLVDGLRSEREQGITIDVAYRYFATAERRFIVADTPGHFQYTRNMVTAASTSDLAVIVVDAGKGVLEQTRRHASVISLMGIHHVVLAINKMDSCRYQQTVFQKVADDFENFARKIGIPHVTCIPVSALKGDNIVQKSGMMPWYKGFALLEYLEDADVTEAATSDAFRLPVQWVCRMGENARSYAGTIASGVISVGQTVKILPSHQTASVKSLIDFHADRVTGNQGDAIMLTLNEDVDISRGDMIIAAESMPGYSDRITANIIWMSEEPMHPGRSYLIQMGPQTATATIGSLHHHIRMDDGEKIKASNLGFNDIGFCNLSLSKPLIFETYRQNRMLGSFILIDRLSKATVAAGLIEGSYDGAGNVHWHKNAVTAEARAHIKRQKPACLWFTGLSGAGKSTIANTLEKRLHDEGFHTYILDGDNIRHGLNRDLGFSDDNRVENIRRVAEVARLMVDAGLIVLVSLISPFRAERSMARSLFGDGQFLEIYVETPLEVCESRDAKGLYKKVRQGLITNFTGIGSGYEAPENPEIKLDASHKTPKELVDIIMSKWLPC